MKKPQLRWGVLSCARIAQKEVIPAIQSSQTGAVVAIASRNQELAHTVAETHQIPMVSSSYEDLIRLDSVDAVYIPLPNHLHVQWASLALEAGKHVLCEKPLGLNEQDVLLLDGVSKQYPNLTVAEAFMYKYHPQWRSANEMVIGGEIGELRHVHVHFSYDNKDPNNIRNNLEYGGGALMDIGCYGVSVARWFYRDEPLRVSARMKRDPRFKTDVLSTILLDFAQGSATIVCGTQMQRFQHVSLVGIHGRISIPSPFNIPPDVEPTLEIQHDLETNRLKMPAVNQFSSQCDAFSQVVQKGSNPLNSISDAVKNMRVIDACFHSAEINAWVSIS